MNLNNLGNNFRALGIVVAGALADACSLHHPDVDCHDPRLSDLAYCQQQDAGMDAADAAQKLDAVVDGRADAPEVTIVPDAVEIDVPQDTDMDAADAAIQPDVLDAAAEVFPDVVDEATDAGTDAPDVTIGPDLVEVDVPDDRVTVPDASPEDSADVRDAAVTDVISTPDSADDVMTPPDTTPPADTADVPAETAVDAGPRYTRPAGGTFFLTFDGESGATVNTQIPVSAPFGNLLGGTRSTGFIGNALTLTGTNGEGARANTSALNFGSDNFLLYFDARFSGTASQTPLGQRGAFFVGRNPSGNITFAATDGSCNVVSTSSAPADTWPHIAIVRAAGSVFIMLNGVISSPTVTCPNNFVSTDPSFLGGRQQASGMNNTIFVVNGSLDNIFAATGGSANVDGARRTYCATMEEAGRLSETGSTCP